MKTYWAKRKKASDAAPPRHEQLPPDSPRVLVKCDACGDRFPDAKSMGIHKTRVHFGAAL